MRGKGATTKRLSPRWKTAAWCWLRAVVPLALVFGLFHDVGHPPSSHILAAQAEGNARGKGDAGEEQQKHLVNELNPDLLHGFHRGHDDHRSLDELPKQVRLKDPCVVCRFLNRSRQKCSGKNP